jgi:uncharacterized protein involved in exopolysaccharide biosynthesis
MLLESDSWRPAVAPVVPVRGGGLISRDLLSSICRNIRRILTWMIVTFAAACAVAVMLPPQYVADATLLVLPPPPGTPAGRLDRDAFVQSEVAILSSRPMQTTAVARVGSRTLYPGLYEKPERVEQIVRRFFPARDPTLAAEQYFADHLQVAAEPGGNVIRLQFEYRNPALAAAALNALVAAYINGRQEAEHAAPPVITVDNSAALQQRLDEADQALADFRAKTADLDDTGRQAALLQQRDRLMADLQRSAGEVAAAQQRSAALAAPAEPDPPAEPAPSDAEARRAFELAIVGAPAAPAAAPAHKPPSVPSETLRARAAAALQAAKTRHSSIETQLARVEASLKQWQDNQATEQQLVQARAAAMQDYRASIAKVASPPPPPVSPASTVRVIQYASVPDSPTDLGAWVIGAGALASLVIGVTVALLSHLFRRGYLSPEALERRLGVPVLASIPDLSRLDRSFDRLSDYG